MALTAGLDIGSTTTKVVLVDGDRMVAHDLAPTGASCRKASERLLASALSAAGFRESDVHYTVSTGYGRRLVAATDQTVSELTANAVGARFLANGATVRTIIDIGGQDSKVIVLDEQGQMSNFAMNDKCAAGTGRFLEQISRALEVELEDLGRISADAREVLAINSVCTVFAETEVVSLVAQGKRVPDIVAGVHAAIAKRVAQLARSAGLIEPVWFDGGPAQNVGLCRALEASLGVGLTVPEHPQIATALGAALIAQQRV